MVDFPVQHIYKEEQRKNGVLREIRYFETEEQKQAYLTLIEQGTDEAEAYQTAGPHPVMTE